MGALMSRPDRMTRRYFIAVLLVVAGSIGRAASQQPGKVYRIAVADPFLPVAEMSGTSRDPAVARVDGALFDELRRLGYVEGKNLVVERYSGEGRPELFRALATEVAGRNPDVVHTFSPDLLLAFKTATATIPIVGLMGDPVALGIVSSLARPGGNITGSAVDAGIDVWGKRLELLREAVPRLSRLGFLSTPSRWGSAGRAALKEACGKLSISLIGSPLDSPIEEASYRRAFAAMAQEGADAVYVGDEPEHFVNMRLIAELAEKDRLPAIYSWRQAVEAGGFMAYAFEFLDLVRHNADIIDRILKGARPGEIPIYQAREYKLAINLKTAKALGLTVPASLLTRADEVIE